MKKSEYTRSGARRSGDDYQDLVALDMIVEFLEHPERYRWIRVEADDAGALDDVVALRTDGKIVAKQVKFSTGGLSDKGLWEWKDLLEKRKGSTGDLPSLIAKWAVSLDELTSNGTVYFAGVITNREAKPELKEAFSKEGLVSFERISDPSVVSEIIGQLGSEARARRFFSMFRFIMDQPALETLEDSVQRRFYKRGCDRQGWLNLKDELRSWIRKRGRPSPDGAITLEAIKNASRWYRLQAMPQRFEIASDYVLPSKDFHKRFIRQIIHGDKGCLVLSGSPGLGKSTYLSRLYAILKRLKIPVVRHHYFLSLRHRTSERLDHQRVAESLMSDIAESFPEALGDIGSRNPNPDQLRQWMITCGKYARSHGQTLVIIIDGLDHVWREEGSARELEKLFENLLPPHDGVILILGTQPVHEDELPLQLKQTVPRTDWWELPLLDRAAVEAWLRKHEDDLNLSDDPSARSYNLQTLGEALYSRSRGNPLHLRYTLKAIQEQDLQVSSETILALPECHHEGIVQYYEELWHRLNERSRMILYLFAMCPFSWTKKGIVECFCSDPANTADINHAVKQTIHLMVHDALGLRVFHSSLLVFVRGREDFAVYQEVIKRKALSWLKTSAPPFLKWGYEWLIEAELGDSISLVNAPNREWMINGIVNRYPYLEGSELLARSGWTALLAKDLPRYIEIGMMRDYFGSAHNYRSSYLDMLLHPQLLLEVDPQLRSRLESSLTDLRTAEIAIFAQSEAILGNSSVVARCFNELNRRISRPDDDGEQLDGNKRVSFSVQVAAYVEDISPQRVVNYAFKLQPTTKGDNYGRHFDTLQTYTDSLRICKRLPELRELLKLQIAPPTRSLIFRNAILGGIDEGIDLRDDVLLPHAKNEPFAAIYAYLKDVSSYELNTIQLTDFGVFQAKPYEIRERQSYISDLFYNLFFSFLANHLWHRASENSIWLAQLDNTSWHSQCLSLLDRTAEGLSKIIGAKSTVTLSWLYERLQELPRPVYSEDRQGNEYAAACETACYRLTLDIFLLFRPGGSTAISKLDLEQCLTSDYFHPWAWMKTYATYARPWLTDEAALWIMDELSNKLRASITIFTDRTEKFSLLASVAAMHGFQDLGRRYLREAADNLISYGEHKDVLLFGILDVIRACHKAKVPEARHWLLMLAAPVDAAKDFTDGDETSDLPKELGDVVSEVAPDLTPAYYSWLCSNEDYSTANSVFHSFLETADLSQEINQAIAGTAVDRESLKVLEKRAGQGDKNAQAVLANLCELLGPNILVSQSKDKGSNEAEPPTEGAFDFQKYPPECLQEFVRDTSSNYAFEREQYVEKWFKHWVSAGRGNEAFMAVNAVGKRVDLRNGDLLFDFAISNLGKEAAYPFLVKAHIQRYAWESYGGYENEATVRIRWSKVKHHYPERWFTFLTDTIRSDRRDRPWSRVSAHNQFLRLAEYCFFMEKVEIGKGVAERSVASLLELVTPITLRQPEWTAISE